MGLPIRLNLRNQEDETDIFNPMPSSVHGSKSPRIDTLPALMPDKIEPIAIFIHIASIFSVAYPS
jgi:hypothetical protein